MNSLFDGYNNALPAYNAFLDPSSAAGASGRVSLEHDSLRYLSSDADSFASSSPESPRPGAVYSGIYALGSAPNSPLYSQFADNTLFAGGSPYSSTSVSPGPDPSSPRVSQDEVYGESSVGGRDYPVFCLSPGCDAKPFKRRADLIRHYKHKHSPDSDKESYFCDYSKCVRRHEPFHRRDHFRDHLRDFHKEDIERRGRSVNEEWLGDRNTSAAWWRCAKCLVRNYVDKSGYECPTCKTKCQPKRKALRQKD
ncbi:hypothetical protein VHEMI00888 [[Torrubiella] hemipterigena]|uniref:C2H2-type domain-containing protein n=1 Tax=[Torrubiella] hemipterigena TaxID=1531966 RepID=A0A0A1T3S4_9HYPO|nr:hypothetical protein VHEMI00888 [[Torrubiella] hemipterigena]